MRTGFVLNKVNLGLKWQLKREHHTTSTKMLTILKTIIFFAVSFYASSVCANNNDNAYDTLLEWFQTLSRSEILPNCKTRENVLSLSTPKGIEPLIYNVACSEQPNVSDNFYFEKGEFTIDGKFSGFGSLYIFDRLDGNSYDTCCNIVTITIFV